MPKQITCLISICITRFEKRVYIRLPDQETRNTLLKLNMKDIDVDAEVLFYCIFLHFLTFSHYDFLQKNVKYFGEVTDI